MFALLPVPHGTILPPQIISPIQYAWTFPSSPSFTNLVIFLLPDQQLPANTLAGIYLHLPSMTAGEFKLLGALGPVIDANGNISPGPEGTKLSAIFKVAGLSENTGASTGDMDMDSDIPSTTTAGDITVGISIEPIATLGPQVLALNADKATTSGTSTAMVTTPTPTAPGAKLSTKVLAQRIIQNAFNFLASFASGSSQDVVPLKAFEEWWKKFERRVEADPGFLERET